MWRFGIVEVPDRKAKRIPGQPQQTKSTIKRTIGPCSECSMQEHLGCGWLGKQAPYTYEHTKGEGYADEVAKTCPEYYASQPAVVECYEHLADYKRAGLGNALDLPAPLLDGLRILEMEHSAWEQSIND